MSGWASLSKGQKAFGCAWPKRKVVLLEANPRAKAKFDRIGAFRRFSICHQIQDAKRLETRERRMAKFLEMLLNDEEG